MHGMKSFPSLLDVKTNRIDDSISAGHRLSDRSLVVNVCFDGLKFRVIKGKEPLRPIWMPRCNPYGEVAPTEMPNDAAAEKTGFAEHGGNALVRGRHGQVRSRGQVESR